MSISITLDEGMIRRGILAQCERIPFVLRPEFSSICRFFKEAYLRNHISTARALITGGRKRFSMKVGIGREMLVVGASLLFGVSLLASCSRDQAPTSNSGNNSSAAQANANLKPGANSAGSLPSPAGTASITATPNPVPAGKDFGKTTITWSTGDGIAGQVYVSVSGGPEKLFADDSPQGFQDAPWIGAGSSYDFRLYAGKEHKNLLASVKVARNEK